MRKTAENSMVWRRVLRREMMSRRAALTAESHGEFSRAIAGHLLAGFPQLADKVIAFCWPIKNEPDVRGALEIWRRQGGRTALPVVVKEDSPLAFRLWGPDTPLALDRYGIPSPLEGDWVIPEVIILPVNAFDQNGYRLGYGGGYFDRTLAVLTPRPLVIGVGFEMNRVETIHPEPHDQRLDWIVTEAGAFSFSV